MREGDCVCVHSVVSYSLQPPWTAVHKAPLSMGFPRQEYWSGLPFPSPGDLPDQGIEPESPALAGEFFTTAQPRQRRQWHSTPVLLSGEPHGRRSLVSYSPQGHKELDTTE